MKMKKHLVAAALAVGLTGSAAAMSTTLGGPSNAQAGYLLVKYAFDNSPVGQALAQGAGAGAGGLIGLAIGKRVGVVAGAKLGAAIGTACGPIGTVVGAGLGAL